MSNVLPTLRVGSKGEYVVLLQRTLNELKLGQSLLDDGSFGPSTQYVVKVYQQNNGLLSDGIVGQATWTKLGLWGVKVEEELDYEAAAIEIGCELAMIKAVAAVESSGNGFTDNGKLKMLFERHIFRRYLLKRNLDKLVELLDKNYSHLCSKVPGGYIGGEREYTRLKTAASLHEEVAYEAASYGRFQIMGFRYDMVSTPDRPFNSAKELYNYLKESEVNQLDIFVKFIKADQRLLDSIKTRDFLNFALVYNGPNQQGYDKLIEEKYNQFIEE